MKKFIFTLVSLLSVPAFMLAHSNISITTNSTQLVLQVKDNGRLYQTYLGNRLSDQTNLDDLCMPYVTPSDGNAIVGGSTTTQLIKEHQRAWRYIVQDIRRLSHLHHKG